MRTKLPFLLLIIVLFVCSKTLSAQSKTYPDYSDKINWVILTENDDEKTEFDVFYIYPTLIADEKDALTDWSKPEVHEKITGFAKAQTSIFKNKARIFAPFIRQLEYTRIISALAKENNRGLLLQTKPGELDAIFAFKYYLKHYNNGRPYILLGHSQGAANLYNVIKFCPEITRANGFAAAYLIGIPNLSLKKLERDFAGRDISPAKSADDTAVIVVWNTQTKDAASTMFTGKGSFAINPLNWKTDATPAYSVQNLGSVFYNFEEPDKSKRITEYTNYCGAVIDLNKGALIVDFPVNSFYDTYALMGNGICHCNDIWFFAENLAQNAANRVKKLINSRHD
jgi:hypothetical protein